MDHHCVPFFFPLFYSHALNRCKHWSPTCLQRRLSFCLLLDPTEHGDRDTFDLGELPLLVHFPLSFCNQQFRVVDLDVEFVFSFALLKEVFELVVGELVSGLDVGVLAVLFVVNEEFGHAIIEENRVRNQQLNRGMMRLRPKILHNKWEPFLKRWNIGMRILKGFQLFHSRRGLYHRWRYRADVTPTSPVFLCLVLLRDVLLTVIDHLLEGLRSLQLSKSKSLFRFCLLV